MGLALTPDARAWHADIEFADDEHADRIYRLYRGGYLNAVSIGFKVLHAGPPDHNVLLIHPDYATRVQRVIYRCKLIEISAVPIPSNPEALQIAIRKGLVTSPMLQEFAMPRTTAKSTFIDCVANRLGLDRKALEGLTRAQLVELAEVKPADFRASLAQNVAGAVAAVVGAHAQAVTQVVDMRRRVAHANATRRRVL